jgi:methionyl aminopeptidase
MKTLGAFLRAMIHIKTAEEIEIMRAGGAILARVRDALAALAKPGVALIDLDKKAQELIEAAGAKPAFLGYKPAWADKAYPASICASVNDVVVHGVPTGYKLKEGDVLKIDIGVRYKGLYTDTAVTVCAGEPSKEARHLIDTTRDALVLAIDQCVAGRSVGDIGFAINAYVRKNGLRVVKGLTGHGVGKKLHEDPVVPNEGKPGIGPKLETGMTLAIEPMVTQGSGEIEELKDGAFKIADGALAAQFEHTIAITESGPEILTQ